MGSSLESESGVIWGFGLVRETWTQRQPAADELRLTKEERGPVRPHPRHRAVVATRLSPVPPRNRAVRNSPPRNFVPSSCMRMPLARFPTIGGYRRLQRDPAGAQGPRPFGRVGSSSGIPTLPARTSRFSSRATRHRRALDGRPADPGLCQRSRHPCNRDARDAFDGAAKAALILNTGRGTRRCRCRVNDSARSRRRCPGCTTYCRPPGVLTMSTVTPEPVRLTPELVEEIGGDSELATAPFAWQAQVGAHRPAWQPAPDWDQAADRLQPDAAGQRPGWSWLLSRRSTDSPATATGSWCGICVTATAPLSP
jgi:hypothetical protein